MAATPSLMTMTAEQQAEEKTRSAARLAALNAAFNTILAKGSSAVGGDDKANDFDERMPELFKDTAFAALIEYNGRSNAEIRAFVGLIFNVVYSGNETEFAKHFAIIIGMSSLGNTSESLKKTREPEFLTGLFTLWKLSDAIGMPTPTLGQIRRAYPLSFHRFWEKVNGSRDVYGVASIGPKTAEIWKVMAKFFYPGVAGLIDTPKVAVRSTWVALDFIGFVLSLIFGQKKIRGVARAATYASVTAEDVRRYIDLAVANAKANSEGVKFALAAAGISMETYAEAFTEVVTCAKFSSPAHPYATKMPDRWTAAALTK